VDGRVSAGGRIDHPRPQLVREPWWSLDGTWDYHADAEGHLSSPDEVPWDERIVVPFAPETPASGIGRTSRCRRHWYRRRVEIPDARPRDRVVLRFNAVDHAATVWVNGIHAADHEGGYTPFAVDLTRLAAPGSACDVVVRADDDPDQLDKPRGKQTWREEPHGIWYPRTSGIWQTVWMERLPSASVSAVRWTTEPRSLEIGLDVGIDGAVARGATLAVELAVAGNTLVRDRMTIDGPRVRRRISLRDPGQVERHRLLWSPGSPTLIDATLAIWHGGDLVDRVTSYVGIRSVEARDGRFWLNDRPIRLRLVLDQGYWPDTGLTPPSSDALRRDVELARALGFNGVRKHQKVEDPRFLAWADRLGLLVWSELPAAFTFSTELVRRAAVEWMAIVEAQRSHPCVCAWVPFNESWGVPDLPYRPEQRAFVRALTALARALDGTRPVVSNDGWETVGGDVIAIHDYDGDARRVRARYADRAAVDRLLAGVGPNGRPLTVAPPDRADAPVLVTEFGGIAIVTDGGPAWGYHTAGDAGDLVRRLASLAAALRRSPAVAGFCYTQLTDTYQEANGLLTEDRVPKAPIEAIRRAIRGR
jgi:hypothetical protein